MSKPKPSPRQLEYQEWEFGLFLHFNIATFSPQAPDQHEPPPPAEKFNPTALDCGQWADAAAEAGMKYAVLTTKHHNGFCIWPSEQTDYTVASSPWRGGEGDVVREFVEAFRARGIKIGLYCSPWDKSCPIFDDEDAYDEFFLGQVRELMGNYGPVDMLWLDGFGSQHHSYDWDRILGEARALQPGLLIFNMGNPDFRWVGNEAGLADLPNWNVVERVPFSMDAEGDDAQPEPVWLPAECDVQIRGGRTWFNIGDDDLHLLKDVDELMGIYDYSVGRGANLLLNIAPDQRGLLPDADVNRLIAFTAALKQRFAEPIACEWTFTESGWSCDFGAPTLINAAVIQEDLTEGEHVRRFRLKAAPTHATGTITVYEGQNIGHKAIVTFPTILARHLTLEVTASDGPFALRSVEVFKT